MNACLMLELYQSAPSEMQMTKMPRGKKFNAIAWRA